MSAGRDHPDEAAYITNPDSNNEVIRTANCLVCGLALSSLRTPTACSSLMLAKLRSNGQR